MIRTTFEPEGYCLECADQTEANKMIGIVQKLARVLFGASANFGRDVTVDKSTYKIVVRGVAPAVPNADLFVKLVSTCIDHVGIVETKQRR